MSAKRSRVVVCRSIRTAPVAARIFQQKTDEQQQIEFKELTLSLDGEEVREMISVYEERGIEKGSLNTILFSILTTLKHKFGDFPESLEIRLRQIDDIEKLNS